MLDFKIVKLYKDITTINFSDSLKTLTVANNQISMINLLELSNWKM